MALKRSAGVGAMTLCVALASGHDAFGLAWDAGIGAQDRAGSDEHAATRRLAGMDASPILVARRGFGATGRQTASSSAA